MKKIIFLFLFVSMALFIANSVSAILATDRIGNVATATAGVTEQRGVNITVNKDLLLLNVTVGTACDATINKVYLYDRSGNLMATSTMTNKQANFSTSQNITLLQSQINYYIVADKGGAAYTACKDDPYTFPFTGTNINAQNSVTGGSFTPETTILRNIQNITTTDTVPIVTLLLANATTTSSSNITINASATANIASLSNITFFVWYTNGTIFNMTTNTLSGTTQNSSVNLTNVPELSFLWNAKVCTTVSCGFAPSNFTFTIGYTLTQQSWVNVTQSGTSTFFGLNMTLPSGEQITNAYLIYNNTNYAATISSSGSNYSLSRTLTVPTVSTNTLFNFTWNFVFASGLNFTDGGGSQTVNSILLDNCSTFSTRVMNLNLFDEDTLNPLNGTIELLLNLYTANTTNLVATLNRTYNYTYSTNPAQVCLQNLNSTYDMNYEARYNANSSTGYETEFKYGQKILVNNSTIPMNISLYDLLTSSSTVFNINVQGADLTDITGAIVEVMRQYVGRNQFISVESPLTDSTGKTVAHLVSNNVVYNFLVYKNGALLGTFNSYLVKCQNAITGDCSINLNLLQQSGNLNDYQNYGNISVNMAFNRPNRVLQMDFLSTDNANHNVTWFVMKLDAYNNNTICTNSIIGSVGTFTCTVPQTYGNVTLDAEIYSDGVFLGRSFFSLEDNADNIIGGTRVLLGLLMYSTLTLLFIAHPVTIVIGAILGMGFAGLFHFIDGGTLIGNASILAWFIIAGAVIIFYMRNKI